MDPTALGLPHRKPFLFLDRVTELVPGESAQGEVCFPAEAPMFKGHFPGRPIVPGVILTEALAQLAGIAGAAEGRPGFLLSAIRGMKFPAAAQPDETISLSATRAGAIGGLVMFDVEAKVGARHVAAGSLVLAAADENPASHGAAEV